MIGKTDVECELTGLCYRCHDEGPFRKANIHPPVAGGECLVCHDPHASDAPRLLKLPVPAVCQNCHTDKTNGKHILGGSDHLLFLAALLLRGGSLLALLEIVTAFTLAHSLTLALAVLGVVTIPSRVVEPAIAASIVWVAIQNVRSREPPRRRWLVSFAFGLVYGFGFASALSPLGLPAWSLARALLLFNLGVEAGQALVVAAALPLLVWMRKAAWEPRAVRAASVALALLGTAWFVQRVFFV